MNRKYTKEQYLELVSNIRQEIPDISITTDIIVGFPGENADDISETIDVIKKAQFENAFTYVYSKRTGTPAASMEEQVAESEVKIGFDRILEAVHTSTRQKAGHLSGLSLQVLVEEINEQDSTLLTGRLSNNTLVHFKGTKELIGTLVQVRLEECKGFYYFGKLEG